MPEENLPKISFHYIKNNDFRTSFATGIYGGITVNSLINIDFFIDRSVIPRKTVSQVSADGKEQDLASEKESRDGAIREVQFGVIMDVSTAKSTIAWLQDKVNIIEEINKMNGK